MSDKTLVKFGLRKMGFAILTQTLILICSLVTSLIIPKYMGKEMYGYWQIYYFYLNYINFITFGYNDGIVLKYSGKTKEELPIEKIRRGNIIMLLGSIVIAAIGLFLLQFLHLQRESTIIFSALFVSMPFVCIFNVILSIFLAVNQQEKYNIFNFINRFVVTVGYCTLLISGIKGYIPMIQIDVLARALIAIACACIGVYFWKGGVSDWKSGWKEVKENCTSGIFITLGALCSSFAPLAGRVVLEHNASISDYALFAFAMSILALVVTFTNAAGIVFFPILKKLNAANMSQYYDKIKNVYYYLIYGALFCYFPAVLIIKNFLPEYAGTLEYVFLIVALCVPLGKMQILITPYMKAYRLEREYLIANIICAFFIWGCDSIVYSIFENAFAVSLTTLIIYEIWNILLESYLKRKMNLNRCGNTKELLILTVFVFSALPQDIWVFLIGYLSVWIIILVKKLYNKSLSVNDK